MSQETFDLLCQHVKETALLRSASELLQWDERTKLPAAAGAFRAEQITYLSGLIHARQTDPKIGEWLGELADSPLAQDPHSDPGTTIRQLRREYEKLIKMPQALVEELTRAAVLGQQAWAQARESDDFASFQPLLQRIVELKREQAEAVGYSESPYDALLDDFEPDATTAQVAKVLEALRVDLVPLVGEIADSGRTPRTEVLRRHYPRAAQEELGLAAAAELGFDLTRGRLDVTSHPFCTSLGPNDCRITTRYDERYFPSAFFSILHEAGHGMYDQGLRREQFGLPPGTYVSLGVHESQSRLWENCVGRSKAFWQYFYAQAQQQFPESLGDVELDEFWFAINDVRPSLIRVEADECTYNLHIIIRFELEQALISGDLSVSELPVAWNDKYKQYLGIEPPNDADGVLQDIHWSAALIGYFPTYSLGNLYSAQLYDRANRDIGPLPDQFRQGDFRPLLEWLNLHIHQPGQCFSAAGLIERVAGETVDHQPLVRYLRQKYGQLYGISSDG